MNLRQQLDCLNDNDYNAAHLQEQLEDLFNLYRNYKIFKQGLEENCYVNTETDVSISTHSNLDIDHYQQAGTTIKKFIFTITDSYPENKLLHVKIGIWDTYRDGVNCYVYKNDKHLTNDEIIECFKDCFGF